MCVCVNKLIIASTLKFYRLFKKNFLNFETDEWLIMGEAKQMVTDHVARIAHAWPEQLFPSQRQTFKADSQTSSIFQPVPGIVLPLSRRISWTISYSTRDAATLIEALC